GGGGRATAGGEDERQKNDARQQVKQILFHWIISSLERSHNSKGCNRGCGLDQIASEEPPPFAIARFSRGKGWPIQSEGA
ncbi:MAG: hypothetical protein AABZ58_07075, partial [Chloroflexota bacterium]